MRFDRRRRPPSPCIATDTHPRPALGPRLSRSCLSLCLLCLILFALSAKCSADSACALTVEELPDNLGDVVAASDAEYVVVGRVLGRATTACDAATGALVAVSVDPSATRPTALGSEVVAVVAQWVGARSSSALELDRAVVATCSGAGRPDVGLEDALVVAGFGAEADCRPWPESGSLVLLLVRTYRPGDHGNLGCAPGSPPRAVQLASLPSASAPSGRRLDLAVWGAEPTALQEVADALGVSLAPTLLCQQAPPDPARLPLWLSAAPFSLQEWTRLYQPLLFSPYVPPSFEDTQARTRPGAVRPRPRACRRRCAP